MSINEALRSVCPSLSVKIALGVGLFNNALLAMGTERHNKYYEAAWKGEVSFVYLSIRLIDCSGIKLIDFFFHYRLLHV